MLLVLDWQRIYTLSLNCAVVVTALLLSILFQLRESALVNTLNQFRAHGENGVLIVQHLVISFQIFLLALLLDWELIYDFT